MIKTWRKSARSEAAGQCVEVRNDLAAIRDSKNPDATLDVNRTAIARLTMFAEVKR